MGARESLLVWVLGRSGEIAEKSIRHNVIVIGRISTP